MDERTPSATLVLARTPPVVNYSQNCNRSTSNHIPSKGMLSARAKTPRAWDRAVEQTPKTTSVVCGSCDELPGGESLKQQKRKGETRRFSDISSTSTHLLP